METEVRHPGLLRKPRASILVAAAALILFPTTQLLASSATWDGDSAVGVPGDGVNWTNADNWSENGVADVLPNSWDDLTFGGGTVGTISLLGAERYANSITFNAGFTLGEGGQGILNIASGDVTVNSGVSATINAQLAGGGGLTLNGGGTLALGGDNTYWEGGITVNTGTLIATYYTALAPATNPVQINLSGTLDLNGTASADNVTNAGTININGTNAGIGDLTNSGTVNVNSSSAFSAHTNTGTYTISADSTLSTGSGGSFTQSGGTLTINGLMTLSSATFNYNGGTINGLVTMNDNSAGNSTLSFGNSTATGGEFDLIGNTTTSLGSQTYYYTDYIDGGTIPAGTTVNINPSNAVTLCNTTVQLSSDLTNSGTLNLLATGLNHSIVLTGFNLTNTGTLNINPGPSADGGRTLDVNLINSGNININASTITESIANSGNININASTITGSITNSGNITLAVGKSLSTGINSVTQSSGTLTLNGNLALNGSTNFYDYGGTITGAGAVTLASDTGSPTIVFGNNPAAGGTFDLIGTTTSTITAYKAELEGSSIPAGATVNIEPSNTTTPGTFTVDSYLSTNAGTINILATGLNHNVELTGNYLTNTGTININPGPTADGGRLIMLNLNNYGAINVNASTALTYSLTNNGAITIAAGKVLSTTSGSFTQAAGTLTINGSLSLDEATFYDNGGTIAGAVTLSSNLGSPTLYLSTTPAAGGIFNIVGATTGTDSSYTTYISNNGSIPAGATLNINPSNPTTLDTLIVDIESGSFTNAGTLNLLATGLNNNITIEGNGINNTGTFNINPGPTGGGARAVEVGVGNSGTFNINTATTLSDGFTNSGTMNVNANLTVNDNMSNSGNLTIAAGATLANPSSNSSGYTFTQSAGTLAINGALQITDGTFDDDGGAIAGTVTLLFYNVGTPYLNFGANPAAGGTFNLDAVAPPANAPYIQISGDIPAGTTVNIAPSIASAVENMEVEFQNTLTNAGTITLSATGQNHNIVLKGSTLNNTGALTINPGPTADGQRTLEIVVNNSGTFDVNASTTFSGYNMTNSGSLTVAAGKTLSSTGSASFTQSAGTLTINGVLRLAPGEFYDNGGTMVGAVTLAAGQNGAPSLSIGSTPAANSTVDFVGNDTATASISTTSDIYATTIPADMTLNLAPTDATGGIQALTVELENAATNAGTINLFATGQNHSVALSGTALTNIGTINSNPGPTADGTRALTLQLTNSGTININANTNVSASLTNTGTINIAAGKTLSTNPIPAIVFTQSAGTLGIDGALTINSATFDDNGGMITGQVNLVTSDGGRPQLSFGSAPAAGGAFNFLGNTAMGFPSSAAITGAIPAGVTVNVNPSGTNLATTLTLSFTGTNAGTMNLLATNQNNGVAINGIFSNTGTININPGPTADGVRTITVSLNNSGTININASTNANVFGWTNSGDITIAAGKTLTSGQNLLLSQSAGTLEVDGTLNWSAGSLELTGGTLNVAGHATVGILENNTSGNAPATLNISGGNLAISPRTTTTQNILDLSSISITSGGQFDLTNNDLIVNYSDPSVASSIQSDLASGYAAGAWDGPGIISSTATSQTNHATALGYIDTPGVDIEIKYTWLGDTDLSGTVDNTDLLAMSPTGTTWSTGDFNYDGKVNADDYALFMLGDAASGGANISTLPEPIGAAGMLLTMLAAMILNRYPKSFRRRDI